MTNTSGRRQILLLAIGVEGGLIVLAWLLGLLLGMPAAESLHWTLSGLGFGFLASVPMLAGFFACVRWPVGPFGRILQFSDEVVRPLFASCSLAELGLISVLAGFGEEMLFRGVIQGGLSQWLGVGAGVVIASFVFGLAHSITITYFLLAAGLGAYLAGWWLMTGNLLVPVVAHAFYDFVALVYLVRGRPSPGAEV